MQMKRVAQIKTQSCRPQLADVDSGVVRWMKMNSVAHPFQPLANINENLIQNGGFVPLLTKTLCMRHNNQFVLERGTLQSWEGLRGTPFFLPLPSFKELTS